MELPPEVWYKIYVLRDSAIWKEVLKEIKENVEKIPKWFSDPIIGRISMCGYYRFPSPQSWVFTDTSCTIDEQLFMGWDPDEVLDFYSLRRHRNLGG